MVDVDDLDEVVDPDTRGSEQEPEAIAFRYCGYSIEVTSDRTVHVEF